MRSILHDEMPRMYLDFSGGEMQCRVNVQMQSHMHLASIEVEMHARHLLSMLT
jgi:hypothetical protein